MRFCASDLSHGVMQAAEFLMRRMAAQPAHCRLLCDDDNDLSEHVLLQLNSCCEGLVKFLDMLTAIGCLHVIEL